MWLLLIIPFAAARCSFSMKCQGKGSDCEPIEVDTESWVGRVTMCPEYDNKEICCNPDQDEQLRANFQAIDATFGYPGGGCDICAINLKRFWCEYTCSPRQRAFAATNGYSMIKDPLNPALLVRAQMVEIRVQPQVACEMWQSCKRTQFASQVTAMKTPGGFFNFQGENAVGQAKQFITVKFAENAADSINFPRIDQCNKLYPLNEEGKMITPEGFEITNACSCNNCDLSCDAEDYLYVEASVFEGFNTWIVFGVWGGVLLLAATITIIRRLRKPEDVVQLL